MGRRIDLADFPPSAMEGDNRNIPPSTISALVQHQSKGQDTALNDGLDVFVVQYVREIRADPEKIITNDPVENCALIYSLVQTVRHALNSKRESSLADAFVNHILACFEIIDIAIKRNIFVLFQPINDDRVGRSLLCLWLLPKILELTTLVFNYQIQDKLIYFLATIVDDAQNHFRLRKFTERLRTFYQLCLEDLVHAANTLGVSQSGRVEYGFVFPSAEAREVMNGSTKQLVVLDTHCQLNIQHLQHAQKMALYLIAGYVWKIPVRHKRRCPSSSGHADMVWITEVLGQVLNIVPLRSLTFALDQERAISSLEQDALTRIAKYMFAYEELSSTLTKVVSLLVRSTAKCLGHDISSMPVRMQESISTGLYLIRQHSRMTRTLLQEMEQYLVPVLQIQISNPPVLHSKLIQSAKKTVSLLHGKSESISSVVNGNAHDNHYAPVALNDSDSRPTKRRKKTDLQSSANKSKTAGSRSRLRNVCKMLGDWNHSNLAGLDKAVSGLYSDLAEDQQKMVLQNLLAMFKGPQIQRHGSVVSEVKNILLEKEWDQLFHILSVLTLSSTIRESNINRALFALTVEAFLRQTPQGPHRDLQTSSLAKWCLQNFRSSVRQIRLVVVRSVPSFLDDRCGEAILQRNKVTLLEILKQLANAHDPRLTETTILAFGQIARICVGDERAIALNQLIEYLGQTSKLLCDMTHVELKEILADTGHNMLEDLFKPYWKVLGVTIVKDLLTRPQKVHQLTDLLNLHVDQFLSLIQAEILPWLVLEKKRDILQRLAKLRSKDASVWDLIMPKRNLPAILALIIVQHPEDIELAVTSYLNHASQEFKEQDTASLLRTEPVPLACEVLKLAGDRDGAGQDLARQGFLEFAIFTERKGQQAKSASTQARSLAVFFDMHALGMMITFSFIIDSNQEQEMDKRRCVKAIRQMILVGQANIVVALPQIRASLQSALLIDSTRNDAFLAWATMVKSLHETDEIAGLIDQTFAIVVQNWDDFSAAVRQEAHDTIAELIKNHSELVQNMIVSLPSLGTISLLSKFESQLAKFRDKLDVSIRLQAFTQRCSDERPTVVLQALRELSTYLELNQQWVHDSSVTEQPNPIIPRLIRSLLDVLSRYSEHGDEILELTANCLGIIGCLDPNRVETVKDTAQIVVLSNFEQLIESVHFVAFLLENILVPAFNSATNPRLQGFLAFVMQELLRFCGFSKESSSPFRPYGSQGDEVHQKWLQMSDQTRTTLTPFLNSRYMVTAPVGKGQNLKEYPLFNPSISYGAWLRDFVQDLMERANGENAKQIFSVASRVVRWNDPSIATFFLPFVATNVILGGTQQEVADIGREFITVLQCDIQQHDLRTQSDIKLASDSMFRVLDYLTRFLQDKKKALASAQTLAARSARPLPEIEEQAFLSQISSVDSILKAVPADIISRRAVECGSYARALFHWEQHMRHARRESLRPQAKAFEQELAFQRLQDIYSEIDEPDGIEGISTYLHALKPEQQVLEHKRASRWSAVQSWYELKIREEPQDLSLHIDLLDCLKHAGQYQLVLEHAMSLEPQQRNNDKMLSIISEAAWSNRDLKILENVLSDGRSSQFCEFNTGVGVALIALQKTNNLAFEEIIKELKLSIAGAMGRSAAPSMQACHDQMMQLHALYELQVLSGKTNLSQTQRRNLGSVMHQRLNVLGSYLSDKQYLLSLRRSVMSLTDAEFSNQELSASWLATAKLARKENWTNLAYNAVWQAAELGDEAAKVELAKLLWRENEHRKAIKSLETAIELNTFSGRSSGVNSASTSFTAATAMVSTDNKQIEQNLVVAKAHLLLAKWWDLAGQTQSNTINIRYQLAARSFTRWEKGLYSLGRFYNKLLESEKALPSSKQSYNFLAGETAKLVIENFLRSLMFGCKYLFESVPKLLTLWLDFGNDINRPISKDVADDLRIRATDVRPRMLDTMNKQIKKYSDKLPAYLFYTALAQMVTRISHSNKQIYDLLAHIIIKVVAAHPQQGLWPLLAVVKSTSLDRAKRANDILNKLMEKGKSIRNAGQDVDLRSLVTQGQKLSTQLLHACEVKLEGRSTNMSLTKDLGFNTKVVPCALVVPVEQTLSASLPTTTMDSVQVRSHRAFPMSREAVTISSFQDEVLVLNSLQRPRKLTARGSDGRKYGLLCKPNDDLRKDQRLMEFNAMINRQLKKDAESSKRRLYIKTYAVTPLNETCGLIEWVDGLKPMRDILLTLYRSKGTKVDYNLLRELLNEACAKPENYKIFSEQILPMYEPVLHEWFTENFSDPESWFTARLRYTRSAAVASMQGYALGLGDRHGENVLLEENTGGIFHVDFNCLFEKGLTFDKPELVPFRLTHNMTDAFGAYGVEGPFRKSAECSMKVMRAGEDALLTIMETFVYDPTTDFVGPRKRIVKGVPETPKDVLESVRSKLRGMMRGESVPLSVEGHVDALIKQATDPKNLCAMYIGWCAFL